MSRAERLRFITPLPPLATGIAQYSRDLLQALNGAWPLDVVGEPGSSSSSVGGYVPQSGTVRRASSVPTIVQIGNSGYHRLGFKLASSASEMVVLHDVVLHHGRLAEFVHANRPGDYRHIMETLYGAEGRRVAKDAMHGRVPDDLGAFPLFEDIVRRSRLSVVHSDYARKRVLQRVPDANVIHIPMGIPLPQLTSQRDERECLRLPHSAFIIASITHVNPYKRIPVVLRALRRLIDRVPDALLVVAGSVAPSVNLAREIRLMNLEQHVLVTGYVTDTDARSLARAADVCVNLRYPSAGETSASLLRLLGAARPVLVTDDAPMSEYPRSAVLPIPVDRFEDEFLAELLLSLADDTEVRHAAGVAARQFVEQEHSMSRAVAGYARAIDTAFGLRMPEVPDIELHEQLIRPVRDVENSLIPLSVVDSAVVDAVGHLRLVGHDATMSSVVRHVRELRLSDSLANDDGG